jgi:hypothetical protein
VYAELDSPRRLILRRKRTWLLVLLTLVDVLVGPVWWVMTETRDFERKVDQLKLGRSFEEALVVIEPDSQIAAIILEVVLALRSGRSLADPLNGGQ